MVLFRPDVGPYWDSCVPYWDSYDLTSCSDTLACSLACEQILTRQCPTCVVPNTCHCLFFIEMRDEPLSGSAMPAPSKTVDMADAGIRKRGRSESEGMPNF